MDIQIGKKYIYTLSPVIDSCADHRLAGQLCTVISRNSFSDKGGHLAYNVRFPNQDRYYLFDAELTDVDSVAPIADIVAQIKVYS